MERESSLNRWLAGLLGVGLLLSPGARADDPLDDLDGTEGWDQVAPTKTQPPRRPEARPDPDAFQREIADWEAIRLIWEQERESFVRARAAQKRFARSMRRRANGRDTLEINDANLDQATQPDDWGDAPGEQWLVPASSVDRAIDGELEETRPAPAAATAPPAPPPAAARPAPPPTAAPTALTPPSLNEGPAVPSAFKQPRQEDLGGGLAPTSPNPQPPLPPPPAAQPASADDGAKAAAEMLRRQQEEERRRKEAARAQREREAAEGAAAAARLLEMQAEQERKEQEALRKKAGVKMDDEGQVVDPELQQEMNEDGPPED